MLYPFLITTVTPAIQTIKKANWKIKDDFRVYNNQGHHFYILEK